MLIPSRMLHRTGVVKLPFFPFQDGFVFIFLLVCARLF
jgi:hypothetical protein